VIQRLGDESGTIILMPDVLRLRIGKVNEKYGIFAIEKSNGEYEIGKYNNATENESGDFISEKTIKYSIYKIKISEQDDYAYLFIGNDKAYLFTMKGAYMLSERQQ
jgi:hypothetical protein